MTSVTNTSNKPKSTNKPTDQTEAYKAERKKPKPYSKEKSKNSTKIRGGHPDSDLSRDPETSNTGVSDSELL